MARFTLKKNETLFDCIGEEKITVLIDNNTGHAWLREQAEKRYVGTFGRETPVYAKNPHGVRWYKLIFKRAIATEADYQNKHGDLLVCSGAWTFCETGQNNHYAGVSDGSFFTALENAWRSRAEVTANA